MLAIREKEDISYWDLVLAESTFRRGQERWDLRFPPLLAIFDKLLVKLCWQTYLFLKSLQRK